MKIPKEEYREVIKCLKNYTYNQRQVKEIEKEILGISVPPPDSPKTSSGISDTVFNKLMELETDEDRKKYIRRCRIVENALLLLDKQTEDLFREEFILKKSKWEIINNIFHISESTYDRRKRELVYTTYQEYKKLK